MFAVAEASLAFRCTLSYVNRFLQYPNRDPRRDEADTKRKRDFVPFVLAESVLGGAFTPFFVVAAYAKIVFYQRHCFI